MMAVDLERFGKQIEAQARVVLGEVQGASWLQRNWRPLLMLTVVAIVANIYIIYPNLSLFSVKATILELPESPWRLMEIGKGGGISSAAAVRKSSRRGNNYRVSEAYNILT